MVGCKNPKGSNVTYDLYLGTDVNPTTLYESNIDGTSFEVQDRLHLITDFKGKLWMINGWRPKDHADIKNGDFSSLSDLWSFEQLESDPINDITIE